MDSSRSLPFVSVVAVLCLGSLAAHAQRAQAADAPQAPAGRAFHSTRYLSELETTPANVGPFAMGDLDHDGDLDYVACVWPSFGQQPTGLQTWSNGGHGDFHLTHALPFANPEHYYVIAQQVFLADITGDGVLDVAYDRRDPFRVYPSGILVHPGLGNGAFGSALALATNGPPQEFCVGDCDGDGDADVLVHESNTGTDYLNTLAWWRYEGGSFVSGARLQVDAETPLRLMATDIGADGIADAVAGAFSGYDTLQVFRTVGGDPTLVETLPLPAEFHDINQRQLTGDIDGDGHEDVLMVLDDVEDNVFHLLPILCPGAGYAIQPPQTFANPISERPLSREGVLADWDGDGDLDLVSPTFSWLENVGGATFELAAQQYSGWSGNGGRSPLHVVDVDGDGHLDALAHHLLMRGDGTFPRITSLPPLSEALPYAWTRSEDVDGDGDLDLTSPYQLQLNNGDGSFAQRSTTFSVPNAASVRLVGWDDFDGDGLRDLVVSSFTYPPFQFDRMWLFAGTEEGPYASSATVPSSLEIPIAAATGDLDVDGDVDLLATDGYWANDGTGRFGVAPIGAYLGTPLDARDIDGDTDVDLLVSRSGRFKYLRNQGGLALTIVDLGVYASESLPVFLDVDEDGDLDFVVAKPPSGVVEVREQLVGGSFGVSLVLSFPGVNATPGLADADGDGRLDLLASRQAEINVSGLQLLSAYLRGPGFVYGERREWVIRDVPRVYADFDGDGDAEPRGSQLFRNLRYDGAADGRALQYGFEAATAGTGGRHPILGSHGPTRPGQPAELRVVHGVGQASGVLLVGLQRADVLEGGIRRLVDAPVVARSFVLGGTPGAAGQGSLALPLGVRPNLVGRTFDFQAVLVDPGASAGASATNGLEIRFGDWPMR